MSLEYRMLLEYRQIEVISYQRYKNLVEENWPIEDQMLGSHLSSPDSDEPRGCQEQHQVQLTQVDQVETTR